MKHHTLVAACVAGAVFASPAIGQTGNVVTGSGSAPVTRDANAVRAQAEGQAKFDLVRSLARQTLGAERLGELTPAIIEQLATQIRPDMIVDRSAERVGQTYTVTLSADIARDWFIQQLDAFGIESSNRHGGGQQQRIVVMIDEAIGVAPDYSQPSEVVTEYDRDRGASYSDKSTLAYSDRSRSGSSSSLAAGQSARGSYGAGYSNGYGSGAATGSSSNSSALAARSASASSQQTSLIDRTNVEASAHDNVRFRQRVTYQSAANSATGHAAVAALTQGLTSYDVATSNAGLMLATFQPGPPPLFADLQNSGRLSAFFQYAQTQSAPFFMAGALEINHGGRHPATGEVECSGSFVATAYRTDNGTNIGAASPEGTTTGRSTSDCENRLTNSLASQAAAILGPQIQRASRSASRAQVGAVAAAMSTADYTLTVRGKNLGMDVQADLLDALASLPGAESHAFLGQDSAQINLQVRYGGPTPLHLALYQRLRGKPAFATMQAVTAPQSVTLCLDGC